MGNVLIIDDEPAIGDYLARLISRSGHQVVTVLNASAAFEKLADTQFQLVIADIRLPDAPDSEGWIRSLTQKSNGAPVVLISGAASDELNTCAQENGVLAFLSKPFELAFVRNILENVFGK